MIADDRATRKADHRPRKAETMRVTLSRNAYDAGVRAALRTVFTPAEISGILSDQNAKPARLAEAELSCRGVMAMLDPDRTYLRGEIDRIVEAAEVSGWLTGEALECRAHGLSLAQVRGPILAGSLPGYEA